MLRTSSELCRSDSSSCEPTVKRDSRKAYCIDSRWLGYAKCSACKIRSSVLFADLDEGDLDRLLKPIEHYVYRPHASFYSEGEAGKSVFTIREGVVKLVKLLPNGTQRVVRLLRRGDAAGLELLVNGHYHHTAVAITAVDVCRIGTDVIQETSLTLSLSNCPQAALRRDWRGFWSSWPLLAMPMARVVWCRRGRILARSSARPPRPQAASLPNSSAEDSYRKPITNACIATTQDLRR